MLKELGRWNLISELFHYIFLVTYSDLLSRSIASSCALDKDLEQVPWFLSFFFQYYDCFDHY